MDTVTSTTLLELIKDGKNDDAWSRFSRRYRPMIIAFARRMGLQRIDAEDIAQETLLAFVEDYQTGGFRREKGGLRAWLFTIARRKAADARRRQKIEPLVDDKTSIAGKVNDLESSGVVELIWEEEWQRSILQACMNEVTCELGPQTLAAFNFHVLKEWPAEKVAGRLNISTNAVYIAKNRVLSEIRRKRKEIEAAW